MKILVLNGSPRPNGNTAKMVAAFREGAESVGSDVTVVEVCKKEIHGCIACEYCHTQGNGKCVQKDDMIEIYDVLKDVDMLVLASPIYYHGISGQLKCVIDRFYSAAYPTGPKKLKKAAMFLNSGASRQYEGAKYSYENNFLGYLRLKNMGFVTCAGGVTQRTLDEVRSIGAKCK